MEFVDEIPKNPSGKIVRLRSYSVRLNLTKVLASEIVARDSKGFGETSDG